MKTPNNIWTPPNRIPRLNKELEIIHLVGLFVIDIYPEDVIIFEPVPVETSIWPGIFCCLRISRANFSGVPTTPQGLGQAVLCFSCVLHARMCAV